MSPRSLSPPSPEHQHQNLSPPLAVDQQGTWYPSFDFTGPISPMPPRSLSPSSFEHQHQNLSPPLAVDQHSYATSEASTDRIEYQSVASFSSPPSPNDLRPTWNNGFGHNSWLGSESPRSIQHSGSIHSHYVVRDPISPGLFGPRTISPSSRTSSPVPGFPVLEERTNRDLHLNGTTALPGANYVCGFSQAAPSVLPSPSSVENGRRGVPQFYIPSWLGTAPSPVLKEQASSAVQDTESIRLQLPYSSPYPSPPEPLVVQPPKIVITDRRGERPRTRPPLPTPPRHAQATPQFALRSHSPHSDLDSSANNYYAQALPSRWNGRTPVLPMRSVSPVSSSMSDSSLPIAQPPSPGSLPHWKTDKTPGWTSIPHARPPRQCGPGSNFIAPSNAPMPPPWVCFGSNNQAQTSGSVLNRDYPSIPASAPPCLNPWGVPAQRRLRFAPLPPTPGNNASNPAPRSQPPPPPLPLPPFPPPPLYNFQPSVHQQRQPAPVIPPYGSRPGYLYSTPAPVIPLPTTHMDMYPRSTKFWFTDGTVIFRVSGLV